MICHQCLKPLNDLSLYCDRCGVKLHTEKVEFEFDTLEKYILNPQKEISYPIDLVSDIKKAYYLTTIIEEENADNQTLIEEYLMYVYLRILYERDKNYLLTDQYSSPKAKAILNSLVNRKITKELKDYLEEEFPEEIEHQILPKEILKNIDKPYLTELNIKKILPKTSKIAIWFCIIKSILMTTIVLIIIGAGLLYLYFLPDGLTTSQMLDQTSQILQNNLLYVIGGVALIILIGLVRGLRNKKLLFLSKIMKQNHQFHKHVKRVCNKKYKTLNYRIKKGKRT